MKTVTFDPDKWQLVPKEPTKEMVDAACAVDPERESVYTAYLTAAPQCPEVNVVKTATMGDRCGGLNNTYPNGVFPMKDHEKRELVNALRDCAVEFHSHQSLRERLAHIVLPALTTLKHPEVEPLTDEEIAEIINQVDYSHMVTADDIFYLIARATERRVRGGK